VQCEGREGNRGHHKTELHILSVQGQVPSGEGALRGETSHKHAQCSKA
jgi:hypothetical protein